MTRVTLSKHEYMWNLEQGHRTEATGYRVGGLPVGHEALINNFGAPRRQEWRVLPIKDNVSGERFGHFKSADEALNAVAERLKTSVQ
jgi:hypothetical protein